PTPTRTRRWRIDLTIFWRSGIRSSRSDARMNDPHNHHDRIMAAMRRKPFVPFTIVLRNGAKYEVHDRHNLAIAEENPYIIVLLDEGRSHDAFKVGEIASVELTEAVA